MFIKKKNNIIILGKYGFIASEIIKKLQLNNYKISCFSKNDIDLLQNKQLRRIDKVIKKNDILLFCSAIAPVKNINIFFKNIKMIENFLSLKNLNKLFSICYLSSDAVFSDSNQKLNEKSNKNPNNLHGLMHLTREKLIKLSHSKVFCLRPTLVFGKNDPHNSYGPNSFIRSAIKEGQIKIFGNGEELRDHIHVDDIAKTFIGILKNKFFEDVNIVSGKILSFIEIANQIKKKYKNTKIIKMKRKGPIPHNGYRAFDNKILKKINIKPTNFKEYFKKYEKI
jgi:nucleoside-diphosphate-sugar epimerase